MSRTHSKQWLTHGNPQTWEHRVQSPPILSPIFLLVFLHMLGVNFCCMVVAPCSKMLLTFVHYWSQGLTKHEEQLAKLVIFFNNKVLPLFDFVFIVTRAMMFVERLAPSSKASWEMSMKLGDAITSSSWFQNQSNIGVNKLSYPMQKWQGKHIFLLRLGVFILGGAMGGVHVFKFFLHMYARLLLVARLSCFRGDAFIHVWRICLIRFYVYKSFLNILLNAYHEWKMNQRVNFWL